MPVSESNYWLVVHLRSPKFCLPKVIIYPQAKPLKGAIRLTRHLHRHQIPQALASSSSRHH